MEATFLRIVSLVFVTTLLRGEPTELCSSNVPVEFINTCKDLTPVVTNLHSSLSTEIPNGGYQTVDTLCQKRDKMTTGRYTLSISKGTLAPVKIVLQLILTPSESLGGVSKDNLIVDFDAGFIRGHLVFDGTHAETRTLPFVLEDGTKIAIFLEGTRESYHMKFRCSIQYQ